MKASRQNEPKKWFKWKRQGRKYLRMNAQTGQWTEIKSDYNALPATKGERFTRTYETSNSISYGGGAYGSYSHFYTLNFRQDGTFDSSNNSIGGTGTMQGLNGYSSTTTSLANKDGCSSATVASASDAYEPSKAPYAAGGSTSQRDCGATHLGTYTFDGYTLELHYQNGQAKRLLFFYWDNKKDYAFIGDATYMIPKK